MTSKKKSGKATWFVLAAVVVILLVAAFTTTAETVQLSGHWFHQSWRFPWRWLQKKYTALCLSV